MSHRNDRRDRPPGTRSIGLREPTGSGRAPWRTAFVRNAEIDATALAVLGLICSAGFFGYHQWVTGAIVLGCFLAVGGVLIRRQVILDRHRDRWGKLAPKAERPWYAR